MIEGREYIFTVTPWKNSKRDSDSVSIFITSRTDLISKIDCFEGEYGKKCTFLNPNQTLYLSSPSDPEEAIKYSYQWAITKTWPLGLHMIKAFTFSCLNRQLKVKEQFPLI